MVSLKEKAVTMLNAFKGNDYVFGTGCLGRVGALARGFGKSCLLITRLGERNPEALALIRDSLAAEGIQVKGPVPGAAPNTPREDVVRLAEEIKQVKPDHILVAAGGSGIDAAKAADVIAVLGGDLEAYFGTGKVSGKREEASSSAAHLTKYSNVTDLRSAQKKLIVDEAVVPPRALFDYGLTVSMPPDFTLDGAFDGMAHSLEVFYGAGPETLTRVSEIASVSIELIVANLARAVEDGKDLEAREALGLATDLGGYAIMVGGTNGGHLTSFSLVDILSHGRACAILNPYYTVFFGPAIRRQLLVLAGIFRRYGLMEEGAMDEDSRKLAEKVAGAMIRMAGNLGFPTTLAEVEGFSEVHIRRALAAAKNPQLAMKLKNMPVPLTADMVDRYMEPVLRAAATGDFSLIRNVPSP